jgi:hypothetical protein
VESAVVARDTVPLGETETHLVVEIFLQDVPEPDDNTMGVGESAVVARDTVPLKRG